MEPLAGQRPLAFVVLRHHPGRRPGPGGHRALGHRRPPGGRPDPGARRRAELAGGRAGQLGKPLFTTYLFAFEITAALLVIAVVGAVVLARRPPPCTPSTRTTTESELPA